MSYSFWIKIKLEWFIRLVKEPKRMWKRYLYYGPVFLGYVFRKKVKILFTIQKTRYIKK
jgi:N-acetylglucosaminyldiphosphoundecaprenol N-acetyl-beta-D-mannosaminyltransferase